jgi:hypothetical protein
MVNMDAPGERHAGVAPRTRVSSGPVLEYLALLLSRGWSIPRVQVATGLSDATVRAVRDRRWETVDSRIADAIMSCDPEAYMGTLPADDALIMASRSLVNEFLSNGGTLRDVVTASGVSRGRLTAIMRDGNGSVDDVNTLMTTLRDQSLVSVVVDVGPARAKVERLLAQPATVGAVSRATGVDARTLRRILDPTTTTIRRRVHDLIEAAPDAVDSLVLVEMEPVTAHVWVLTDVHGFTTREIARAAGLDESLVRKIRLANGTRVTADVAEWILGTGPERIHRSTVDASTVTDHVRRLCAAGLSVRQIAAAAQSTSASVRAVRDGTVTTVTAGLAKRLGSVSPRDVYVAPTAKVSADESRAMLEWLTGRGFRSQALADASGLSRATILGVLHGRRRRVTRATADRILAIDVGSLPIPDTMVVDATTTVRQVWALIAAGVPQSEISARTGVVRLEQMWRPGRGGVTYRVADAVDRAYRDLAGVGGSDRQSLRRARLNGWLTPGYWDEPTIGVIDAYPSDSTLPREVISARRNRVALLVRRGRTIDEVSRRLRVPVPVIRRDLAVMARSEVTREVAA